jgi:hypothetical protein
MSKTKKNRDRNFQTPAPLTNTIAEALDIARPRDSAPRTLPRLLPGCSLTADGELIPEDERAPQIFEDGAKIAVCNHVARELQRHNTCNRRKSKANIKKLRRTLACNEWVYNGKSSTLVCSNTAILDNQHTLEAFVQFFEEVETDFVKKPFLMRVEMGLPPETFSTYDIGARRTTADTLHVEQAAGNINYGAVPDKVMSSSVRLLLQYLNNVYDLDETDVNYLPDERAAINNSRVATIVNMYPQLVHSAEFVCSIKGIYTVVRPHIPAVAHMLISEVQSETAANNFVRALASGSDLPEGSPILALRSLFLKMASRKRRMEAPEALAYSMHAWNKFASGKDVELGRLKSFGPEGKIPLPQKISRTRELI